MGRVSHEKDGENGVIVGHLNIWAGISLFRQIIFELVIFKTKHANFNLKNIFILFFGTGMVL